MGVGGVQAHVRAAHNVHRQPHFLSLAFAQQHIAITPLPLLHTRQPSQCYKTAGRPKFSTCFRYEIHQSPLSHNLHLPV
jgi:hypothetical protein